MNLMTLKGGAVQSDTSKTLTLPVLGLTPSSSSSRWRRTFFGLLNVLYAANCEKDKTAKRFWDVSDPLLFFQYKDFGIAWQANQLLQLQQMWILMRSNWTKDSFSGFLDPIKGFNNTYNRPRPLHKGPKVDAIRKGDQYLFASTILGNIRFSCWIKYS